MDEMIIIGCKIECRNGKPMDCALQSLIPSLALEDQHGIAVGEEVVFFGHGHLVGFHQELISCKGSRFHHHGRLGQVEVRNHAVGHRKGVGREDKLVGPALERLHLAINGHGGF